MNRAKGFWLGLLCTLAVLLPAYLAVAAYSLTRAAPADTPQSNVPIAAPTSADARTLLLMTGEEEPQTFVLVRFDALANTMVCISVPADTVVLCAGQPATLAQAVQAAGPAQAAAGLRETLGIPVDHYLFCDGAFLAQMAGGLGNARMRLANYMSGDALAALRLDIPGVETLTLTPDMLREALQKAPENSADLLRAEGYLAFLRAGSDRLQTVLPDAMRTAVAQCSTNLTAVDIYDYERVFRFLARDEPQVHAAVLPGERAGSRYELGEPALATAREWLGAGEKAQSADESGVPAAEESAAQSTDAAALSDDSAQGESE